MLKRLKPNRLKRSKQGFLICDNPMWSECEHDARFESESESEHSYAGYDETSKELETYESVILSDINPRLTSEKYQGQFIASYLFFDEATYQKYLRLLPDDDSLSKIMNPQTSKVKMAWNLMKIKATSKKTARNLAKKLSQSFNQYALILQEIEKDRNICQPDELGHIKYNTIQGNSSYNYNTRHLTFEIDIDINFCRMPCIRDPNWLIQQSHKVKDKYQVYFRLFFSKLLEMMETLEKFIYFYQPDLQQLREVGTVYNGLINWQLLDDLTQYYHQMMNDIHELNKIRAKVPSKEWAKAGMSNEMINFSVNLKWNVQQKY